MAKKGTDNLLRTIPLFRELSARELREVSSLMTPIDVEPGYRLMAEGEIGRDFMIIASGTAVVRRRGRKVAEVGPGDFIGEVSVLSGARRNADVIATSPMTVEVLSSHELHDLLERSATITYKIMMAAIKRLAELERSETR
jgi:CRP-like cAMP-binding protein